MHHPHFHPLHLEAMMLSKYGPEIVLVVLKKIILIKIVQIMQKYVKYFFYIILGLKKSNTLFLFYSINSSSLYIITNSD